MEIVRREPVATLLCGTTAIGDQLTQSCIPLSIPGQHRFASPTTVTQALAQAGVDFDVGGLSNVIVIRMTNPENPRGMVLDVKSLLKGDGGSDVLLSRDDVVYVPRTRVASWGLFVEQYVEKLMLFRGFSVGYQLRDFD